MLTALKVVVAIFVVILGGVALIWADIAVDWNRHCHSIPLHSYVCRDAEAAALQYEEADYPGCLGIIAQSQEHPRVPPAMMELHYIKALCLQASGRYSESGLEYSFVSSSTGDENLKERADIGRRLIDQHNSHVLNEQILFPDWAPGTDGL